MRAIIAVIVAITLSTFSATHSGTGVDGNGFSGTITG
jgi:hypothetical protein